MNKEKYYVRNKDLLPEIQSFKDTGVISEELGLMVLRIATNYSSRGSFASYTWKEDMVSEAVLTCFKYMHNFDPSKQKNPNPFAYFTTIIHNAFINYIRKQNKHSEIKDICYKKAFVLGEELSGVHYTAKAINYQELRQYDSPRKKKRGK
jgi:RNA polymerase sigma factor (sigma-70 family)